MTVDATAAPAERQSDNAAGAITPFLSSATGLETTTGAVLAGMAAITGATEPADVATIAGGAAPIGVRPLESGIVQVTLPANEEIAGAEARVAGAAVRAIADGRRVPVMLVITGVVGVSVEARQVYVSSIAVSAFALVGESPVDRVIAHYLLRSKTEAIPARFFTSEAEAVEWLGQYASEN